MKYRQHTDNHVGANILIKSKLFRIRYVLSGKVFKYINLLIVFLKIKNIEVTSTKGIFMLAIKARHLRRRRVDQFFSFFALILYGIIHILLRKTKTLR